MQDSILDKKLSLLLLLFAIPLLFLPKFNILAVGSETAGIRYDDVVLFIASFILLFSRLSSKKAYEPLEKVIFLITAFSLVSFVINRLLFSMQLLYVPANLLYALRLFEYFLFFYIGFVASHYMKISSVIGVFFLWNVALIFLQRLGVIGAITVSGYHSVVSERVYGIASFPSEMGLILNLLYCFFAFKEPSLKWLQVFKSPLLRTFLEKSLPYWMAMFFAILIIFTGNRISLAALLVTFLVRVWKDLKGFSFLITFFFLPLIAIGGFFAVKGSAGIYERSLHLLSYDNVRLSTFIWDRVDLRYSPMGNEKEEGMALKAIKDKQEKKRNYDPSWKIRIHKWIYAAKSYLSLPLVYFQGLGPGFAGSALDGGILRIVVENGLLGAYLYFLFFYKLAKINPQMKWMTFSFVINMLFFDAYLAYKSMSLFLFAAGGLYSHSLNLAKSPFSTHSQG